MADVAAITGPGLAPGERPPQDEAEEHDKDTPWAVVLPLAFAIPLAPAFLRKRSGGQ